VPARVVQAGNALITTLASPASPPVGSTDRPAAFAAIARLGRRRISLKVGFLTGAESTTRSTDVCRSLLPKRSI
jgi:hypothetical protein